MDYYLRARHWQLFIVLFGMFLIAGFVLFSTISQADHPNPPSFLSWVPALFADLLLIFWLWSLGSFLRSIINPALRLNTRFFRFALIYPLFYALVFVSISPFFFVVLRQLYILVGQSHILFKWAIAMVMPFHLLMMYCLIYNIYFVAKSLALAESGKSVSFINYIGTFFLIWMFPIGIWIIQPRVNRLYATHI
jgi:hypothetical protein